MTSDAITNAVACNLCTGCGACAGTFPDFIKMVDDQVNGRCHVVNASSDGRKAGEAAAALCAGIAVDYTVLPRNDAIVPHGDWFWLNGKAVPLMTRCVTVDRQTGQSRHWCCLPCSLAWLAA